MSDADQFCQVCGAPLTLVQRVDAETYVAFEWQCSNLHKWRQTSSGMTAISEFSPLPTVIFEYES